MARSACSQRLRKTWENIEHRQKEDDARFQWKPKSMKGSDKKPHHDGHHDHHHHHHHDHRGMLHHHSAPTLGPNGEEDHEEKAFIALQQRQRYKKAWAKSRNNYDDLEDSMYESRKPRAFRNAADEVIHESFPRSSQRWLGVPHRFGEHPEEKYVGLQANEMSKWISVDKIARLKQEANPYNWPVRNYVKIDDSINIRKMTGSHMAFIHNPLEDDAEADEILRAKRQKATEAARWSMEQKLLEEKPESSVSSYTTEEEVSENWSDDDDSPGSPGFKSFNADKERKRLQFADAKFQKHLRTLCVKSQKQLDASFTQTETNWKAGLVTRPATLKYRR